MMNLSRRTLLAGLAATFPGAAVLPARAATLPSVVATLSILADITRALAGSSASVRSIIGPDTDPHTYEPRPSDLRALAGAALVVRNGLDLEGWLDRLLPASGTKAAVVTAAAAVTPRHLDEGLDPHAWQDPNNGILYARAITEGLATLLPAQAGAIRARAESYTGQLAALDRDITAMFADLPAGRRRILTSHDAFFYFGARYHLDFIGIEGINTEAEPSAADLAKIVAQVKESGIRVVFVENMTSPALARAVARESGALLGPTVYSDALSGPKGPAASYLAMLRYNATIFARALHAA